MRLPWCNQCERFRVYVEQMLLPTLRPDDIVLLDNPSSHKITGIAEAIAAQRARLIYLPPYSPTSTRSSRPSPSSKRFCAKPPNAPARASGRPSAAPAISIRHENVATSLSKPDMQPDRKPV
jgi:hypothetical protein